MTDDLMNDVAVGGAFAAAEVLRGVTDEKVVVKRVFEVILASLEIFAANQTKAPSAPSAN